jgi:hypothetical protein
MLQAATCHMSSYTGAVKLSRFVHTERSIPRCAELGIQPYVANVRPESTMQYFMDRVHQLLDSIMPCPNKD